LVLDDINLGFRDDDTAWPLALREGGQPQRIVLKTVAPLGTGRLWERLMEGDWANRLTVVVSVAALRGERGALSKALSWDLAIEEIVREFEKGLSRKDLGRCRRIIVSYSAEGAAAFSRCRLRYGRPPADGKEVDDVPAKLERFLYLPGELEGSRLRKYPGRVSGSTSLLTAAVVRHELDPASYPLFIALAHGLAAVSKNQELGGGDNPRGLLEDAFPKIAEALCEAYHPKLQYDDGSKRPPPEAAFRAAFRHRMLADARFRCREATDSDLLGDITGPGPRRPGDYVPAPNNDPNATRKSAWQLPPDPGLEYILAHAGSVVYQGSKQVLADAPHAEYGKYLTFDRQEIERINALRALIDQYLHNADDKRPLSIAVFGPPGSGKSFAIKQLANALFGKDKTILEFNLSQFECQAGALHGAFHQVRDAAVRGVTPLVFWDEFDTNRLYWLKEFLAPMQDAEFREAGLIHPFGKAIFVFAGGLFASFESFQQGGNPKTFARAKGPDFVSRLRGFVNIKGPNPMCHEVCGPKASPGVELSWAELAARDPSFLIRRAIILRTALERTAKDLIDPESKLASVSAGVVRAFLLTRRFHHGARSIESVVTMSALARSRHFAVSDLPPRDQLLLHVTPDFLDLLQEGELEGPVIEALAEACHRSWFGLRVEQGWEKSSPRNKKINPLLIPYGELSEEDKEKRNRSTARLVRAKVGDVGYVIERRADDTREVSGFTESEEECLAGLEHDIWLRARLLGGFEWAETTNEDLRQHSDVAPLAQLKSDEVEIDHRIVKSIPAALAQKGYVLAKLLRIGVIGHRILTEERKIENGITNTIKKINEAFPGRPWRLISPLAEGADRLVVHMFLRQPDVRLEVPLPLSHAEYVTDFAWGDKERSRRSSEEFAALLERAKSVFELAPTSTRDKAYESVGEYVLENSDILIAVWDGKDAHGVGGTAEIVARARDRKLPIAWVHAGNRKPGTTEPTSLGAEQGTVTFENF
jgi:hypothetical protein